MSIKSIKSYASALAAFLLIAAPAMAGTATYQGSDTAPAQVLIPSAPDLNFGGAGTCAYDGTNIVISGGNVFAGWNFPDGSGGDQVSDPAGGDTITVVVNSVSADMTDDNNIGIFWNQLGTGSSEDVRIHFRVRAGVTTLGVYQGAFAGADDAFADSVGVDGEFPVTITTTKGASNVTVTADLAVSGMVDLGTYPIGNMTPTGETPGELTPGIALSGTDVTMEVASFILDGPSFTTVNAPPVGVDLAGPAELVLGVDSAVVYSASSSDAGDTDFALTSVVPSGVVNVTKTGATTFEVTPVALGTATITVTGNGSGASGSSEVTVRNAEWFELCAISDTFATHGASYAGVLQFFGFPADWEEFDVESASAFAPFGGDGIPDAWQMELVAYNLCGDAPGAPLAKATPGPGPDPAAVQASYDNNVAELTTYSGAVFGISTYLDGAVAAVATETASGDGQLDLVTAGSDLLALLGGPCAALDTAETNSGGDVTALGTALENLGGDTGFDAGDTGSATDGTAGSVLFTTSTRRPLTAGMAGLSVEMVRSLKLIGRVSTFEGARTAAQTAESIIVTDPDGIIAAATGCDATLGALLTDIQTAFGTVGAPAALVSPFPSALADSSGAFEIFGTGAVKGITGTHPFSGPGDYNNDGFTNDMVALAVLNAGGTQEDFIAGATGDFGGFWKGNPNLPAAGAVALGLLAGLLAGVGAARFRRK